MGKTKFRSRCFFDISIDSIPAGRIVLELFNELCPKATENFKKLCQGNCGLGLKTAKPLQYQGSIFHRVIKGFMVQGGDFSNKDGTGGESIYGGTFADECLTTPHDRPFLLSMANRGPNSNGSQFFITTAPAPHLDGKHVVFGHVLSGEDVVRKIESVPICDTKTHRPIKPVTIVSCGELIPVKKKKLKDTETAKKAKKKSKKEKKRKHRAARDSSEMSDGEIECSVRPEEVPEVPAPRFLYRGKLEADRKTEDMQTEQSNHRPEPIDSMSVLKLLHSNGSFIKHVAAAVGRELVRATRERKDDRSGRKVKGRGRLCYRSPDSGSSSHDRSTTPPHWRQASKSLQRLDEEGWKKWHEERTLLRVEHSRNGLDQRDSPVESSMQKPPLSPSAAAVVARNRSPSESPPVVNTNITLATAVARDGSGSVVPSPGKPSHAVSKRRPDVLLSSRSPKRARSSSFSGTDSPMRQVNQVKPWNIRNMSVTSPVPTRRAPTNPEERREQSSVDLHSTIEASERSKSKYSSVESRTEERDYDAYTFSRRKTSQPEAFGSTMPSGKVTESPAGRAQSPSLTSRRSTRSPVRLSPQKYSTSPSLRSPRKLTRPSPGSPPTRHQLYSSPSVSPSSELKYASRERRIGRSDLNSPPPHRTPAPPFVPHEHASAPSDRLPQHSEKSPQHLPHRRLSPKSRLSVRDPGVDSQRDSRNFSPKIGSKSKGLSPSRRESLLSEPKTSKSDGARPPVATRASPGTGSPSASSSHSDSSSCESSHRSSSTRSRSHSGDQPPKKAAPRSPPPHLVQKWRMRHQQLIQKRRIAPSASSTYHTPGSSDDRARYIERRSAASGNLRLGSRSRSRSYSPPRRRRVRSSTSHSRSGSSHRRSRHVVGLERHQSPVASNRSRSQSSKFSKSRLSDRSASHSPTSRHKFRNQATSPVKLSKKLLEKSMVAPIAAADDPLAEGFNEPSKWERSQEPIEKTEQRNSWTTSHWQSASEYSRPVTSRGEDATTESLDKPIAAPASKQTVSVLQRLRMGQFSKSSVEESGNADALVAKASMTPDFESTESTLPTADVTKASKEDLDTSLPSQKLLESAANSLAAETSREQVQPRKPVSLRERSCSSSSSTTDSSASSSCDTGSHSSCSPRRSRPRRSLSPFSRSTCRRSDFSDSRSRGRASYYGRYSPIRRSRYSRSRSRSFSTYRSTIQSAYSSGRTRRRSWSRSCSRSHSRDSRSPSSRRRYSSSRHRRGRRSHKYSGFRRPSSSRSRSSSRSYSSSPRRR
ncbi:unnamed protein product [Dicrocoelium dendriticum]|nr:unnamed protein product [Dicrocoelium dendriticum]